MSQFEKPTNFRVDVKPAERWTFSWLFGWRWAWEVWAWCEEEQRWRPPAFVVRCGTLAVLHSEGRGRSYNKALRNGHGWANWIRGLEAKELEKKRQISVSYNTTGLPISAENYELWLDAYKELGTL